MCLNSKLKEILAKELNLPFENINENLTAENTPEWDSLNHFRLILAVEDAFNCKFRMREIQSLDSFEKIKSLLQEYGN